MTPQPTVLLSTVTLEENNKASLLDLVLTVRQAQHIVVVVGSGILEDTGNQRIGAMKRTADIAMPSRTHQMIAALVAQGLLQRCYTQDIGGLETHMVSSFPPAYGMMNTYTEPEERPAGFLMPLVAKYGNNNHPYEDAVRNAIRTDSASRLDVVMVMGTSRQLDGVWKIIPQLANGVSTVIFVHKDPPPPDLSGHFTHHVQGKPDDWATIILDGWDYEDWFLPECPTNAEKEQLIAPTNKETKADNHMASMAELRSMTVSEILEGKPVTPRCIGGVLITKDILGWSLVEAWDLWLYGNEIERRKAWQIQEIYRMIANYTGRNL
ncbi:hypothetical protein FS837_010175 [Tulasnella sp. UAMH 9824]|nr:hypothetical protein FS837_010175 [Tulasnella sp. UAMH 9824]